MNKLLQLSSSRSKYLLTVFPICNLLLLFRNKAIITDIYEINTIHQSATYNNSNKKNQLTKIFVRLTIRQFFSCLHSKIHIVSRLFSNLNRCMVSRMRIKKLARAKITLLKNQINCYNTYLIIPHLAERKK